MRKQDKMVVWTVYFDANKSRGEGRKLPAKFSVPNPKLEEVVKAARQLGLKPEVVPDAAYPKTPWQKTGFILLPKSESKLKVLKKIGERLVKMRKGSVK